jgi:hypothetical protein
LVILSICAHVEVSTGEGRKTGETYSVHALIAPSGWAVVTFALNLYATAVILHLVFAAIASGTDILDIGALIVMCHTARSVVIIDFCVVGVATDAVEEWWWLEGREK